jgi:hypothetical protein
MAYGDMMDVLANALVLAKLPLAQDFQLLRVGAMGNERQKGATTMADSKTHSGCVNLRQ